MAAHGITPAWAGKSCRRGSSSSRSRDHPRVGGEKPKTDKHALVIKGSPPRGRGKVSFLSFLKPVLGITPAWAGKRRAAPGNSAVHWDHPRVGGEKAKGGSEMMTSTGSPPRGRGKAYIFPTFWGVERITPAWAGKSTSGGILVLTSWDHPRVGGEKMSTVSMVACCSGSPPRGRGKVGKDKAGHLPAGITPAWAGKSVDHQKI